MQLSSSFGQSARRPRSMRAEKILYRSRTFLNWRDGCQGSCIHSRCASLALSFTEEGMRSKAFQICWKPCGHSMSSIARVLPSLCSVIARCQPVYPVIWRMPCPSVFHPRFQREEALRGHPVAPGEAMKRHRMLSSRPQSQFGNPSNPYSRYKGRILHQYLLFSC